MIKEICSYMKLARLIQFIIQICVHFIQLNLQIRSWITTLQKKKNPKKPKKNKKQKKQRVHDVFNVKYENNTCYQSNQSNYHVQ